MKLHTISFRKVRLLATVIIFKATFNNSDKQASKDKAF